MLSVAKYYSPEGKSIQDNAVTPEDLVLEPEPSAGDQGDDDADATPQITASDKPNEDSILKKAIEVAQKRS